MAGTSGTPSVHGASPCMRRLPGCRVNFCHSPGGVDGFMEEVGRHLVEGKSSQVS